MVAAMIDMKAMSGFTDLLPGPACALPNSLHECDSAHDA